MQMFVYLADNDNPYKNLAIECALKEFVKKKTKMGEAVYSLFLWQSDNAIVFGRNQNIKSECDLNLAKEKKVKLVRRNTGGGAVYQDLGNINFSIMASKQEFDIEKNYSIIINALKTFGVDAHLSGRNDLLVADGRKISGNAFNSDQEAMLHHGTLLVDIDKELAASILTPQECKLKSKGIDSVRSRIVNLGELVDKLWMEKEAYALVKKVKESISEEFIKEFSDCEKVEPKIDAKIVDKEYGKLISDSWIDCVGIKTGSMISGEWGCVRYAVEEKNGIIDNIVFESDILNYDLLEILKYGLKGVLLTEEGFVEVQNSIMKNHASELSETDVKIVNALMVSLIDGLK